MTSGRFLSKVAWGVLLAGLAAIPMRAQDRPQTLEYRGDNVYYGGASTAVRADVSPPLRDIPPVLGGPTKTDLDDRDNYWAGPCGPLEKADPVLQDCVARGPGDAPLAMPAPLVSFDGWANLCGGCAPPDPNGDVGPNHYVAMANSTIAVYGKTGTVLLTPRNINTLWTGFGGSCETENAGDPVVLYDQFADRWLITQFTAAGPTYYNCVALSTTGDPTGSWQRYAFSNGTSFPDYPKFGVWADGYYVSNRNTSGTTGQAVYAYNRAQMLAGSLTPQVVNFLLAPGTTPYYGGDGLLPADIDGSVLPPAGTPEFFVGTMDNGGPYSAPQDAIYIYKFHVDWTTPANSTFTRATPDIPVAAFDSTFTPCGGGRTCIPQQGTANKIDILSYRQRPTFRAAYRNFGTYQTIVTNQSVAGTATIAGVRWYEIRDPNGTPTLYQQGTYAPGATDGVHRWMGSIAMDQRGNMALGFSASSATMYPSIWYAGRLAGDPLGQMSQGEGVLVNGAGSQTGGGNRWGDYTALTVDPDDCTFWYVNEYYTVSSASTWQLRIGSFRFPTCLCAVTPTAPAATGATASASNQITVNWNDSATASITQYFVYRSTTTGGPYTQIATVADTSPGVGGSGTYAYVNTGVSGGTRYYYVIRANDGASCTSANSNEVNALATGPCLLAPTFAGLAAVTNPAGATCQLNLSWSAGTSNCAGTVTYNVYRAAGAAPVPPAGLLASGVTGTAYSDSNNLTSGQTYYYIVRAVDAGNGTEETNTTAKSGVPTGPYTTGTWSDDGGDTGTAKLSVQSTWTNAASGGRTGPKCYATGTYNASACISATTPTLNVGAGGGTLTFWSHYDIEANWDKGQVELSTDGGTTFNRLAVTTYPATASQAADACGMPSGVTYFTGTNATYASYTATIPAGATNQVRWRLGSDGSVQNTGWWIDDISITNVQIPGSCTTALPGPPGVPNGLVGTAMKGSKVDAAGGNITLTWDSGCAGTNYEVVYGSNLQLPASYAGAYGLTGVKCPIGAAGPYSWNPAPAIPGGAKFLWWLIVATDGATTEGSWGKNTSQERTGPGSGGSSQGATGACAATKSLTNTCGQ